MTRAAAFGVSPISARNRLVSSEAEDSLSAVEPPRPLRRITQQNPGIRSSAGILIICAGSDPAARIGTLTPVYGALGIRPGSAVRGTFYGSADVNREGT